MGRQALLNLSATYNAYDNSPEKRGAHQALTAALALDVVTSPSGHRALSEAIAKPADRQINRQRRKGRGHSQRSQDLCRALLKDGCPVVVVRTLVADSSSRKAPTSSICWVKAKL